jgi:hypothetical protein
MGDAGGGRPASKHLQGVRNKRKPARRFPNPNLAISNERRTTNDELTNANANANANANGQ